MKRVGILRGGTGKNYKSSLKEGGNIIAYILENLGDKYKTSDILVDRKGVWHLNGIPIMPADLIHKVDVVWNVAYPQASSVLQSFSIPHISQSHFSSALENSREMLREHMESIGVGMSRRVVAPEAARDVLEKFGAPWIVKSGSEVRIIKIFNELADVINGVGDIIVEEFIGGVPGAVHSVLNFRDENIYAIPPSGLTAKEKKNVRYLAKNLHTHLGAQHYLKTDFVLHPKRGFFITNIDFSPDLRANSHFEQACQSVGAEMHHLMEHMLESVQ